MSAWSNWCLISSGLKRNASMTLRTLQQIDEALDYREQGLHIRYPEMAKDTTYLSESGELCGWKDPRRRLPVAEENRMRGSLFNTLL
ncbi:hypothetical protein Tco_0571706 [Tanacetum coccineum]